MATRTKYKYQLFNVIALFSVVDHFIRGLPLATLQIVGSVITGVAFIALLMPDRLISINLQRFKKSPRKVHITVTESKGNPVTRNASEHSYGDSGNKV